MVKKFDKVFYRAAGTVLTTLAYADPPAGCTALPAGALLVDKAKPSQDKGVQEALGDGTQYTGSEKASLELSIINFAVADVATIRSAFINQKVDIILIDSNQKSPAWCLWGVRLYPKLEGEGGADAKITLSGDKENSINASNAPLTLITIT